MKKTKKKHLPPWPKDHIKKARAKRKAQRVARRGSRK